MNTSDLFATVLIIFIYMVLLLFTIMLIGIENIKKIGINIGVIQ